MDKQIIENKLNELRVSLERATEHLNALVAEREQTAAKINKLLGSISAYQEMLDELAKLEKKETVELEKGETDEHD